MDAAEIRIEEGLAAGLQGARPRGARKEEEHAAPGTFATGGQAAAIGLLFRGDWYKMMVTGLATIVA
jgi:hypothetical protein